MDRGDLRGVERVRDVRGNRRARERCYCWGKANEGCREGRRHREGKKGAYSHWSENSPILCPEDRCCRLLAVIVRGEDWFIPAIDSTLTLSVFFASLFIPACLEPQRTVSQYKRSTRSLLAEQMCLQLCYLLYHPVLLSFAHTHTHIQRTFSHRHTLTSWQAGKSTPSHYLCAEQFCSCWCEQCGAVFCSSSAAAAATAGRVQRRAIITRDHTPASTIEGKPPFSLPFPSLLFFLVFTWRSVADLPLFPSSSLPSQRVPVGQPWRTPSPAAMPPSPRCSDARGNLCKPVSSYNQ